MTEPLPKARNLDAISFEINNLIASRNIGGTITMKGISTLFYPITDYPTGFHPDCRISLDINGFLFSLVLERKSIDIFFELGLGVPYANLAPELSSAALSWFSNFLSANCQHLTGRLAINVTTIEPYVYKRQEESTSSIFGYEIKTRKFYFALLRHNAELNQYLIEWMKKFPLKTSSIKKEDILIKIGINKGFTLLSLDDFLNLELGDLILIDQWAPEQLYITIPGQGVMTIQKQGLETVIRSNILCLKQIETQSYTDIQSLAKASHHQKKSIENIPILLRFQLKEQAVPLRDIEKYQVGTILPYSHEFNMNQAAICIKDKTIAMGELVGVGNKLAIQIISFIS